MFHPVLPAKDLLGGREGQGEEGSTDQEVIVDIAKLPVKEDA